MLVAQTTWTRERSVIRDKSFEDIYSVGFWRTGIDLSDVLTACEANFGSDENLKGERESETERQRERERPTE